MRRTVPRRPWAHRSPGRDSGAGTCADGCRPRQEEEEEGTPPKVQETVGDLSFVVSRGEMRVEGVGLVVGLDNTGVDPPPSWYRKQLVDEMSKAGVENAEQASGQPPGLDGDRAADDPDWSQSQGPARRPGRSSTGLRHHEPGRRLSADDPAARSLARRRLVPRRASRSHWPRGR